MESVWVELFENMAVVALIVSVWAHLHPRMEKILNLNRRVLFGIWAGVAAVISMAMSIEIEPGIYGDFRNATVSMAGLFGGPVSAVITTTIACAFRLWMGGVGTHYGILGIAVAGALSAVMFELMRNRSMGTAQIAAYAAVLSLVSFSLTVTPLSPISGSVWHGYFLPLTIMGFCATLLSGVVILRIRELAHERDLLRAALAQAPGYCYIKDVNLRFRVANKMVATHHGFEDVHELIGLTDADLEDEKRSRVLMSEERALLGGGRVVDKEEQVETRWGERWYLTNKVPVADAAGVVIGLVGVTQDITRRKHLETQALMSRDLLDRIMGEMSDGVAYFDQEGHLIFCNDALKRLFPQTANMVAPGIGIRTLVEHAAMSGEIASTSTSIDEGWIDLASAELLRHGDFDLRTAIGQWLSVRTRSVSDGSVLLVASDVTARKESELALKTLTTTLQTMAETDGLTGLANRRRFDSALSECFDEARVLRRPFALLMIDVDEFKAYNDHYGHGAGDECLKMLGRGLSALRTRSRDVIARYGGEEFAIILPDTDEDGAVVVAERLREFLHHQAWPHMASRRGFVTASIGIAVLDPSMDTIHLSQIIQRADTALYTAKSEGRDCLKTWSSLDPCNIAKRA